MRSRKSRILNFLIFFIRGRKSCILNFFIVGLLTAIAAVTVSDFLGGIATLTVSYSNYFYVIASLLVIITLLFVFADYLNFLDRQQRQIIAKVIYQVVAYIPIVFFLLLISWRGYKFTVSGRWELVSPTVEASIIGGLFGIVTLSLGNYIGNYVNRKKERENQEYARKQEFYNELIDKLYYLVSINQVTQETFSEEMKGLIGKIYTQAPYRVIELYTQIVNHLHEPENNRLKIQELMEELIIEIRNNLGIYSKQKYKPFLPSIENKLLSSSPLIIEGDNDNNGP